MGFPQTHYKTIKDLLNADHRQPDSWVNCETVEGFEQADCKRDYLLSLAGKLLDPRLKWRGLRDSDDQVIVERMTALVEGMQEMIEDFIAEVEESIGQGEAELDAENAWIRNAEYDPGHWAVGGDAYDDFYLRYING
jgi:hypothetical protein